MMLHWITAPEPAAFPGLAIDAPLAVDRDQQSPRFAQERELELRVRPLREQWEAYGPGMLHRVRRSSAPNRPAMVICIPPSGNLGGGWPLLPPSPDQANPASQDRPIQVVMQAVLTNPHPSLPECVRLAWLLLVAEAWASDSQEPWVAAAKRDPRELIAPVLEAAEWVELVRADEATLALASRVWYQTPFPVYNPAP